MVGNDIRSAGHGRRGVWILFAVVSVAATVLFSQRLNAQEVVPCVVELERLSHISSFLSTQLRKDIQPGPASGPTPPTIGASAYSL